MFVYSIKKQKLVFVPEKKDQPENDNDFLLNYQHEYYATGNKKILENIYSLCLIVSRKLLKKHMKQTSFKMSYDFFESTSIEAVNMLLYRFIKNGMVFEKSFTGYLYRCLLKTLYDRTAAQKLYQYCKKQNVNFFALTMEQRQEIKNKYLRGLNND